MTLQFGLVIKHAAPCFASWAFEPCNTKNGSDFVFPYLSLLIVSGADVKMNSYFQNAKPEKAGILIYKTQGV